MDCLNYLGNPQEKFKSVLIGGTNGKGSVTYYLSSLTCKYSQLNVGRYISPHLVSWDERFVINEGFISNALLNQVSQETVTRIKEFETLSKNILTEFEIYTIIAFCLFASQDIDIAYLEVGMGGRLDATNVISSQNTLCSVITNVSLDHTKYLGEAIEKIALEKAGIIKEKNFIITGAEEPALSVIKDKAEKLDSTLIITDITNSDFYQDKNINIAQASWDIICKSELGKYIKQRDKQKEHDFLKSIQLPGRFQIIREHNLVLDGAHNPQAAEELKKLINHNFWNKKVVYIIGMLDKDYKSFIKNLIPVNSTVICTEPNSIRATKKELIAKCIENNNSKAITSNNLKNAIKLAKSIDHDVIIITGSLYLVGETLSEIHH